MPATPPAVRAAGVTVVVLLRATAALTQPATQTPPAPPAPCAADTNARRFDFWVGEWEVRGPKGNVAGYSRVERVSGGCALLENWTGARGDTGKSLNAYNPSAGVWQQYWVGQGGDVTAYLHSAWDGPTLVFDGRTRLQTGAEALVRLSFTPLPDGGVRQHGEASTDGGSTWTTQYDLTYRRR
jgi:hypothetical protein